jgi:DNA polymerase III subunit beta
MKVEIYKKAFLDAFILGGNFAGKSKLLPILDNVKCLMKENGTLRFISYDNENAISTKMDDVIQFAENISFLLPYKEVVNYVKLIKDEMFMLIVEESQCTIKHSKGKLNITLANVTEYPEIVKVNSPITIDVDSTELGYGLSNCNPFISDDTLRPITCGVHICVKDNKLEFCATDSKSLSIIRVGNYEDDYSTLDSVINRNVIPSLLNALKNDNCCTIKVGDANTSFTIGDTIIISRNIVGKYPNYHAVIPKNNPLQVSLNIKELSESLNRALLSSSNNLVRLTFSDNKLEINSEDFDFGKSSKEELTIDCDFDLEIGVEAKKFIDCASIFDNDDFILCLSDSTRALVFKDNNDTNMALLMPMLLN